MYPRRSMATRALTALALLVAGLFATVGPAQPASAEPCVVRDAFGNIIGWDCQPYLVWRRWRPDPPPCRCPDLVIDWAVLEDPARFFTDLDEGLAARAGGDRDRAVKYYLRSARDLGAEPLKVNAVGEFDFESGKFQAADIGFLAEVGELIATGEGYLQRALQDEKDAGYYTELGAEQLDKALDILLENAKQG